MQKVIHDMDLFSNDLYQFTTSYTYFMNGKHQSVATFQIFFRKHPFKGQYVISAGITAARQFLKNLTIKQEQIQFLKQRFPDMDTKYFDWLKKSIQSEIKVRSLAEGQIVFAKEPIVSYTGPLSLVQLLQTPFLNLIGFASLVSTNASRMKKAANEKKCLQFGLRRAQGPDGALSASHYSFLGGFSGTSNIQASFLLKIPCQGTMSHAFVTSFFSLNQAHNFEINGVNIKQRTLFYRDKFKFKTHDGQLASFLMYAKQFPNTTVCLIDTYSTLSSGMLNAIIVAKALNEAGIKQFGIRLDSGNLCQYSKKCRHLWNQYISEFKLNIVASDDLNEERIAQMQKNNSQIDVYAIGTNIATCQKQPALGLVCKLVSLNNVPVMKFSQSVQKSTYPSEKSLYRVWTTNEIHAEFDLIGLQDEDIGNQIVVINQKNHAIKKEVKILKKIRLDTKWSHQQKIPSLIQSKHFMNQTKLHINPQVFNLQNPISHQIMITQKFFAAFQKTRSINLINKSNI